MSKKAEKANPGSAALRQQSEAQVYQNMQAEMSPPSHLLRGCLRAFLVGGLICLLAQGVQEVLLRYGFNLENVGGANLGRNDFAGRGPHCRRRL